MKKPTKNSQELLFYLFGAYMGLLYIMYYPHHSPTFPKDLSFCHLSHGVLSIRTQVWMKRNWCWVATCRWEFRKFTRCFIAGRRCKLIHSPPGLRHKSPNMAAMSLPSGLNVLVVPTSSAISACRSMSQKFKVVTVIAAMASWNMLEQACAGRRDPLKLKLIFHDFPMSNRDCSSTWAWKSSHSPCTKGRFLWSQRAPDGFLGLPLDNEKCPSNKVSPSPLGTPDQEVHWKPQGEQDDSDTLWWSKTQPAWLTEIQLGHWPLTHVPKPRILQWHICSSEGQDGHDSSNS